MCGFFVSRVVCACVEMWTPLLLRTVCEISGLMKKMCHVHGGTFFRQKMPYISQSPVFSHKWKKTIKWQCRQKKVDICYKTSESVSSLPLESSNLIFFIATAHLSGEACEVSPGGGRGWLIFFGLKLTLEVQVNYFLNGFFHSIKEGCTMSNSSGLLFEWSFWLPGRNQWKNKTFEFRPYPKWPTRPADVFIQRKSFECLKFHKAGCDIGLMSWPLKS